MPVYKDKERGTWYCQFYYTNWQGQKKRKTKRGFARQKDAKEYEHAFLDHLQASPEMTFSSLVDLYLDDMQNRLREHTITVKARLIKAKLLPYFGEMKLCDIKPTTVRAWQNELYKNDFADTYLRKIHMQLSTIFNYAVKYYGLTENPCHKAGSIGSSKTKEEMLFWTLDEYKAFIKGICRPDVHMAFQLLYWCGLRIGELLALTREDFDIENRILRINKSFQRISAKDVITEPKTPKSIRNIILPNFVCEEAQAYLQQIYDTNPETRLFTISKGVLYHAMVKNCETAGVKRIRIHDLRHSHASLLIELGFSPLMIAERLGHENIQTTLDTYSHLYPNKQAELAQTLDSLNHGF